VFVFFTHLSVILYLKADRNHPQALSNLGAMADGGIGMPKNEVLAQEYWMKASQQGIPQAQFNLALYYEAGKGGLEMSSIQSVKYYEMAAARGYAKAFANLGVIYEQGRYNEIKSNIELSIKCYQEAINRGNIAAAAFNLGCIYDEGRIGIPINKSEANKYFKLAKEFKLDENVFKLRWKRWFQQNWIIIAAITALTIQHGIIYMTLGLFWTIAALIIPLTIGIVLAFLTTRRK